MNFIECTVEEVDGRSVLVRGGFCVPLSKKLSHEISRLHGGKIIVGLRPEHLTVRANAECGIPGVVEMVEYLGSEALVYLRVGDTSLIAKGEAREELRPEQPISLLAEWQRACLFDVETKALIPVNDKD